jgi:hypothetical protein
VWLLLSGPRARPQIEPRGSDDSGDQLTEYPNPAEGNIHTTIDRMNWGLHTRSWRWGADFALLHALRFYGFLKYVK